MGSSRSRRSPCNQRLQHLHQVGGDLGAHVRLPDLHARRPRHARHRRRRGPADRETSSATARYVEGQLRELIALCEQVTGKQFDIDRLREVMGEANTLPLYQEVLARTSTARRPSTRYRRARSTWASRTPSAATAAGAVLHADRVRGDGSRCASGIGTMTDEKYRLLFVGVPATRSSAASSSCSPSGAACSSTRPTCGSRGGGIDLGFDYDLARPIESLAEEILLTSRRAMDSMFFCRSWQAKIVAECDVDGVVFHPIKSCRTVSTGLADSREWLMRAQRHPEPLHRVRHDGQAVVVRSPAEEPDRRLLRGPRQPQGTGSRR